MTRGITVHGTVPTGHTGAIRTADGAGEAAGTTPGIPAGIRPGHTAGIPRGITAEWAITVTTDITTIITAAITEMTGRTTAIREAVRRQAITPPDAAVQACVRRQLPDAVPPRHGAPLLPVLRPAKMPDTAVPGEVLL